MSFRKVKQLFLSAVLAFSGYCQAQQNVGIGTLTPSADAVLDLVANAKGLLVPRVTSLERLAIPVNSDGLIVYDTDESKFFYWNAPLSVWQTELITAATFNATSKILSISEAGVAYNLDLSILSQTLDLTRDQLSISDQNSVDLTVYHRDSSDVNELIVNTQFDDITKDLSISDRGQVHRNDLSILSQTLDLTRDQLSISDQNSVDLTVYHKDSSASNELQSLRISNDTILLDRGGIAKLPETEYWNTDGNLGTNPGANFIGTRDNSDLVVRSNNTEKMRVKSDGNIGIGTVSPEQALDVNGVIRLDPEKNNGRVVLSNATVDADGDINANLGVVPLHSARSMRFDGFVIGGRSGTKSVDLPGPINNHIVIGKFKIYSPCDGSSEPIIVNFKKYDRNRHGFSYAIGHADLTESNANTITITLVQRCDTYTLTIALNPVNNQLTFSSAVAGTTTSIMYVTCDEISLLRVF